MDLEGQVKRSKELQIHADNLMRDVQWGREQLKRKQEMIEELQKTAQKMQK